MEEGAEIGQFYGFWLSARDPAGVIAGFIEMIGLGDDFWDATFSIAMYLDEQGFNLKLILGIYIEIANSMAYLLYYSFWLKRPNTL